MKIFSNFRDPNTDPYLLHIQNRYKDKPFTFWYDKFPSTINELNENPYNILFLHEPNEFFGMHSQALTSKDHFTAILTWSDVVLNSCLNSIKFTYNGQTLDNDFIQNINNKKFKVSFLSGKTNMVEGHKLRQKVLNIKSQLTIPNMWCEVLEDFDHESNTRPGYSEYSKSLKHIPKGVDPIGYGRRVLFEDFMFNVVIENVNHNNWYNKIGDNFLSKTIPIYWGCPNISEFGYDERGIIRFNTLEELIPILNSLTPETYEKLQPFIDYNYELAKLDTFEHNINNFFDDLIKINNI